MIAIIGGSGFIGTRLVNRLLRAKYQIKIIDKEKSVYHPELWEYADVRDLESLRRTLAGSDLIVNLAAEHRDDISDKSLYDEVNVVGARNICRIADEQKIDSIVFTSSVAVYGFAPKGTDENGELNPFNDYGRTKLKAEEVYKAWKQNDKKKKLTIIRPTVVFGERNRGNVYNLLHQVASGKFIMVGNGTNVKSMAYVENVAAFLEYSLSFNDGFKLFNYIDKPDFNMNSLIVLINKTLNRTRSSFFRLPFFIGYLGGMLFDGAAKITNKKYPISSIRIKKFCADSQFETSISELTDFVPPVLLKDALQKTIQFEFLENNDGPLFYSE